MSEPKNGGEKASASKLGPTQIILIVGIAVILVAVIIVGAVLLTRGNGGDDTSQGIAAAAGVGNVVMDEDNVEDAIADLKRKAAEGTFEVKMNPVWSFPDGASPSADAYVANSVANHKPLYFDVSLEDTEEVIYTSPVLQLGEAVQEFSLTKDLDAGDYVCICSYHLLNEDETIASTVMVKVRITVKA